MCFGKVRFHGWHVVKPSRAVVLSNRGHLGGSCSMQPQMSDSVDIIKGVLHFHCFMSREKQEMGK